MYCSTIFGVFRPPFSLYDTEKTPVTPKLTLWACLMYANTLLPFHVELYESQTKSSISILKAQSMRWILLTSKNWPLPYVYWLFYHLFLSGVTWSGGLIQYVLFHTYSHLPNVCQFPTFSHLSFYFMICNFFINILRNYQSMNFFILFLPNPPSQNMFFIWLISSIVNVFFICRFFFFYSLALLRELGSLYNPMHHALFIMHDITINMGYA